MTYEPLHHKYRPKTFAELVGQEAIAQTLTNAIRTVRIAPAYLFTGPRGTGKTSSARILAKSLNCISSSTPTETPCGKCNVCQEIAFGNTLDVIEIDAASNTGVDNIRDLIEKAQFAPVQCRYKVYVIDECHMLSTAAFNSLLKTLEEPPDRVVFVLATTDPQRVLPTIISRCQKFDFRRIPLAAMATHLRDIAQKENINIAANAIQMVAQIAQGGLRDAESLLDQLSLLAGEITIEKVWDLVGAVPENDLMALLEAIASNDAPTVLDLTHHLIDRGREPLIVLQNLASFYRDFLIAKTAPKRSDLVALTQPTWEKLCQFAENWEIDLILAAQKHLQNSEVQIKNTTQPRLWLEVTLLGLLPAAIRQQFPPTAATSPSPPPEQGRRLNVPLSTPKIEEPSHLSASNSIHSSSELAENITQTSPSSSAETDNNTPENYHSQPAEEDDSMALNYQPFDLKSTWQQVLAHSQPPTTQEFFLQKAELVSFDGQIAVILIKAQALIKMAKDRIVNIEAAFQKVFKAQVTVRLTVGNSPETQTSRNHDLPSSDRRPSKPFPDADVISDATPPPTAPKIEPKQPAVESTFPEAQAPPKPISEPTREKESSPAPSRSDKQVAIRNDAQAVIAAAQRLANMFNGEVIDLSEEEEFEDTNSFYSFKSESDLSDVAPHLTFEEKGWEDSDDDYEIDTTGDERNDIPF